MILNIFNMSTFAHETSDIKLAYLQSVVSWAKVDGFQKLKIMLVCLDLTMQMEAMENDEKCHIYGKNLTMNKHN